METKFYLCKKCKNVVEKLVDSGIPIVCCGENMSELIPNTEDASVEKHLPVVTKVDDYTLKIDVGSVIHPMVPQHFIAFIYVEGENSFQRINLTKEPSGQFCIRNTKPKNVYAYCNLHGLWKTEIK